MDPTLSEIRMFAGNFAPSSWKFCNGQLLSLSEFTALFSLIGTTYGGDGMTTFALPDLRSRIAVGTGNGPGLPSILIGEVAGSETVTLLSVNLPTHIHSVSTAVPTAEDDANLTSGNGANLGIAPISVYADPSSSINLAPQNYTTGSTGGNQPINIIEPYLAINFIICYEGVYPSRN